MAQSTAGKLLYAMSALICSVARPERKGPTAQTKGMKPPLARPAATPTTL